MQFVFRSFSIFSSVFLCLILVGGPAGLSGQDVQPEPALAAQLEAEGTASMLVVFEPATEQTRQALDLDTKEEKGAFVFQVLKTHAEKTQAEMQSWLQQQGIQYRSLWIVNAVELRGDMELATALGQFPGVKAIAANPQIQIEPPIPADQAFSVSLRTEENPTWGIRKILADSVWTLGYRGEGIVIGGQDTGYDWSHPSLSGNYRGKDSTGVDHNYSWYDAVHEISPLNADSINPCGLSSPVPCDDHGHGTHTMGTMSGTELQGFDIGVAPMSKWIGCRCMERGWGSPSTYLGCFQWFLAPTDVNGENPDPSMAPHVINNSWSCPEIEGCTPATFQLMQNAVEVLRLAGVVVVVSAGNRGSNCSTIDAPPAIFEKSFVVGAIAANDTIAGFSSRGPVMVDSSGRQKPDVVAPGVGVFSARPDSSGGNSSGTSMSGPHVAGLVALVLSAEPALAGNVDVIESIIKSTTTPMFTQQDCGDISGQDLPNNTYGYGIVNAVAAVEAALSLSTPETRPDPFRVHVYPNPTTGPVSMEISGFEPSRLQVYNATGSLVRNLALGKGQDRLEMSLNLPSGTYMLVFQSDIGPVYRKLLVFQGS